MTLQPLEERRISIKVNGIERPMPAIHAEWITPREWVSYVAPPSTKKELSVSFAKENWLSRANLVSEDLRTLLSLPYHVFWSHMVFDRELLRNICKLLKRLPRPHDKQFIHPDEDIREKLAQLTQAAFRLILRMSTFKESKQDFMSATFFAQMVYDNFVFDVPKIVDICSVFTSGNHSLVEKIVENLFKTQPKYLSDLKQSAEQFLEAFQRITAEAERFLQSRHDQLSIEFEDILFSAVDASYTLNALFEAYPSCSEAFQASTGDFTVQMAQFYHGCLSALDEKVSEEVCVNKLASEEAELYTNRIYMAKSNVMNIVRIAITRCILAPVMNGTCNGHQELERLLHLYTGFLSEASFFTDFNQFHPLDEDLDIFRQMGIELDPMRIEYLRNGIQRPIDDMPSSSSGAMAMPVSCGSLVSHVRDLFPQLGEGFLMQCLPYFDNDSEKLINALLEDNLPPHLAELDRTQEKSVENICDTALDDLDLSRLHRGKKKVAKNANALLDDKSDLKDMKERFSALSIVKDEIYVEDADYDDEYDDTYDDNARGEAEPDDMREFVLPRALGGGHIGRNGKQESSSEDEEDAKRPLDFVRNPEEIRQEAEQRRQSKMSRNQKKQQSHPPHRDVVGNAKGQGQDKQVLINRARKNANKNKHHRAMAERKQAKGMF